MKTIEIRGIWLRTEGDYLVLDVELPNRISRDPEAPGLAPNPVEAIRVFAGACPDLIISHYVHPSGIANAPPSSLSGQEPAK